MFQRAKAAANDTKTISNLHQLGVAFELYAGDYDDTLPQATDGLNGLGQPGGWAFYTFFGNKEAGVFDLSRSSVYSYAKSEGIFTSVADADAKKSHLSFAMSGALCKWSGTGLNPGVPTTSLANPSGMMLLGEEGSGEDLPFTWGYNHGTNDGYFNPAVDHFSRWHSGGTAILFADTHTKILHAQDRFVETVCGDKTVCW